MERLHIIALFHFAVICNIQYSTATVCVSSCVGKINGNYQYCPDCRKYVACSNGYRYIMPCPANLVWDDNMKRCEWTSSTCPESTIARTTISELPTGAQTIRSTRPRTTYTTTATPRTTTSRTTTPVTTTPRTTTESTTCGTDKCSTSPSTTTPMSTTETTTPGSTTTTAFSTTTPRSTTETTTPGSTTTTAFSTTTPRSTTETTTPMTTTPNECHIPPPTDCCIRTKMWISLEDGDPVVLGKVPFVNVMEQTTGKCGCDAKILLNATFQKHGDPCQGCTNVPECGNKMLRIDLEMAPRTTGVSFHVGDSRTNNGYKGDASTQEKDAEFLSLGYEHLLYGSDQCPNMSMIMTGLLSNSVTSVTIFLGNEFIRVSNNHGYVYELCSECLFSLNGQSDSQGPVNEDIFIGLNRIIDSSSYRDGTGVCSAVISWACPWSCKT